MEPEETAGHSVYVYMVGRWADEVTGALVGNSDMGPVDCQTASAVVVVAAPVVVAAVTDSDAAEVTAATKNKIAFVNNHNVMHKIVRTNEVYNLLAYK